MYQYTVHKLEFSLLEALNLYLILPNVILPVAYLCSGFKPESSVTLGSIINYDNCVSEEITHRIRQGNKSL